MKRQIGWSAVLTLIAVSIFFPIWIWVLPTWPWPVIWFLLLTLITLAAFAWDKQRARMNGNRPEEVRGHGRVPEVTLLWLILIGGTIGGAIGMWGMHHKTRNRKFLIGFVVALVLQSLVVGLYIGTVLMGPETTASVSPGIGDVAWGLIATPSSGTATGTGTAITDMIRM
ncbi:MAG: DUF1294 domain-containing protein [Planctomycetota bacterium]